MKTFKIVLVNDFPIGSKYRSVRCTSEYFGSAVRVFHSKAADHCGRSFRMGFRLAGLPHSMICNHALIYDALILIDNFKIFANGRNILNLRISES